MGQGKSLNHGRNIYLISTDIENQVIQSVHAEIFLSHTVTLAYKMGLQVKVIHT